MDITESTTTSGTAHSKKKPNEAPLFEKKIRCVWRG